MENYSNDIMSKNHINELCTKHIASFYTIGKQLTIERTGTENEKLVMYRFIDRCIEWSNNDHPIQADLYLIKPNA
ncbi:hypothetical protein WNY63_04980 [Pseudoalteromonas neustonica]|uniref:Uncharacterized protein n=1 Tax=Pseudoalteromonas neustonica TaxID=1840331 RepID=A0ABU9TZ62_9GAMM